MKLRISSSLLLCLIAAAPTAATAQLQSRFQQACIKRLNVAGFKVSQARQRLQESCVKAAAKGRVAGTADDCIAADAAGKVDAAKARTQRDENRFCTPPPSFAATDAATVNDVADVETQELLGDVLGLPVQDAVATGADATCQRVVLIRLDSLMAMYVKQFNQCKGRAIKTATDATAIETCLGDLSSNAKVTKAGGKLGALRAKLCGGADLSAVFPGVCATQTGAAFDSCLEVRARCRACKMLGTMDSLAVDCDSFDDGSVNGSCGALPSTTTTSATTSSTTTTSTSTTSTTTTTTTSTTTSTTTTSTTTSTTTTSTTTSTTTTSTVPGPTTTTTLPPSGTKTVFVTSTAYTGAQVGGLSGGDTICNDLASAAHLSGTYVAWLSSSTVDAKTRVTNAQFVRSDGAPIANDLADLLDGSLANPIACEEDGVTCDTASPGRRVWTGTGADGKKSTYTCSDFSSTSGYGFYGFSAFSNSGWTAYNGDVCSLGGYLYCFEL